MQKSIGLLGGIGLGAAMMYFLDGNAGRRRRAILRDGISSSTHRFQRELNKARRDLGNRTAGLTSVIKHKLGGKSSELVPDRILEARVRTLLGRCVSHPHAIHVAADSGCITLIGDVLAGEQHRLLDEVASIPGVREVRNQLHSYAEPSGVSSLQGSGKRTRSNGSVRSGWTPALRLLAGAGGGALTTWGVFSRGWPGMVAGFAGATLMARAAANRRLKDVFTRNGEGIIDIQKTVHVLAPVDEVSTFLTRFSNLPRFMSHLREVKDLGDGRYHWVAEGPGRVPVSWDSEITRMVPNQLVEWQSLPGSTIMNRGRMRFEPDPDGGTRITIQMCYSPPMGMAGHMVARLFGADPKHEMDEDFVRLKSLLELGRTRARDGRVLTYDPEHRSLLTNGPHAVAR